MFSEVHKRAKKVGQPPGAAIYTGEGVNVPSKITILTYDINESHKTIVTNIEACLSALTKPTGMTWVHVEGLQDVELIRQLAKRFRIHPLTVEDILNVDQRPKVEEFSHYLFVTLKVLHWQAKAGTFEAKQLSLVVGKSFLLSFEEIDTARFESIRKRLLSQSKGRLREQGSDYLAYRLIDVVVDEYFIVLEALGDEIEKIEERIISAPTPQNARIIYRLKRQMLLLRKMIWPMREVLSHLMQVEDNRITKFTRVYLRDVYDHTVQAIDTLETFREMLSSMLDMYLSSLTNRMNEIMKTLTIIATIFIPITAIASIYGMNFTEMPLLHWRFGYEAVLSSMGLVVVLMILYFRKKKWI